MKKEITLTTIIIIIAASHSLPMNIRRIKPSALIKVPEDYSTIQDAVDAANEMEIQTRIITLSSRTSTITTFVWKTSNMSKDAYKINAYVAPVQGELDTADTTVVYGIVIIDAIGSGGGGVGRWRPLLS